MILLVIWIKKQKNKEHTKLFEKKINSKYIWSSILSLFYDEVMLPNGKKATSR